MKYKNMTRAVFHSRPNRFIARVLIDDRMETVHVKNTGRCRELLIPGTSVILVKSGNPNRKTAYDLVTVWKEGIGWVNLDSQAPNEAVKEWIPRYFTEMTLLKPEYKFGSSRIDFYLECGKKQVLMEVKGVTLEKDGIAYFPDAPTERGVKHLEELTHAAGQGYECYIAFVIQMERVDVVYPNRETHPEFAQALKKAVRAGVRVLYLGCRVTEDGMWIERLRMRDAEG